MARLRDNIYIKSFGERVRILRLEKGYTQEHMANLCDIEISQINRIELGKINTSISHARKIAEVLDIPMSKLFDF